MRSEGGIFRDQIFGDSRRRKECDSKVPTMMVPLKPWILTVNPLPKGIAAEYTSGVGVDPPPQCKHWITSQLTALRLPRLKGRLFTNASDFLLFTSSEWKSTSAIFELWNLSYNVIKELLSISYEERIKRVHSGSLQIKALCCKSEKMWQQWFKDVENSRTRKSVLYQVVVVVNL